MTPETTTQINPAVPSVQNADRIPADTAQQDAPGEENASQRIRRRDSTETRTQSPHCRKLSRYCHRIIKAYSRTRAIYNDVAHTRALAQTEWEKCKVLRGFLQESQDVFMEQAGRMLAKEGDISATFYELQEAHKQMLSDHHALEAQAETTKVIEARLEGLDYQADQQNQIVVNLMRALTTEHKGFGIDNDDDFDDLFGLGDTAKRSTTRRNSSEHSVETGLHPDLISYLDAVGNLNLIGEELVDLEHEYQEERVTRLFLEDQGGVTSEENFQHEEQYKSQRAVIEKRLDVAIAEIGARKRKCLDQGIDVDDFETDAPAAISRMSQDMSIHEDQEREIDQNSTSESDSGQRNVIITDLSGEERIVGPRINNDNGLSSSPPTQSLGLKQLLINIWANAITPENTKPESSWSRDSEVTKYHPAEPHKFRPELPDGGPDPPWPRDGEVVGRKVHHSQDAALRFGSSYVYVRRPRRHSSAAHGLSSECINDDSLQRSVSAPPSISTWLPHGME